MNEKIIIFTDGASRGNPGSGGWGAIVVAGEEVVEMGSAEKNVTNNQMEIIAAARGLAAAVNGAPSGAPIEIFTDSSYVINGITKWVSGWRINNWQTKNKKAVLNRELWEELAALAENKNIEWKYLGGHSGIVGNERCDEIATEFADGRRPALYRGPLQKYGIDILNFNLDEKKASEKSAARERSRAAAFSYVSMVDGKIKTHKTWAECENRVKGKSGAKFKKALDGMDEANIIKEFKLL